MSSDSPAGAFTESTTLTSTQATSATNHVFRSAPGPFCYAHVTREAAHAHDNAWRLDLDLGRNSHHESFGQDLRAMSAAMRTIARRLRAIARHRRRAASGEKARFGWKGLHISSDSKNSTRHLAKS